MDEPEAIPEEAENQFKRVRFTLGGEVRYSCMLASLAETRPLDYLPAGASDPVVLTDKEAEALDRKLESEAEAEAKRQAILAEMKSVDDDSMRAVRAFAVGEADEADMEKLREAEKKIKQLRRSLYSK